MSWKSRQRPWAGVVGTGSGVVLVVVVVVVVVGTGGWVQGQELELHWEVAESKKVPGAQGISTGFPLSHWMNLAQSVAQGKSAENIPYKTKPVNDIKILQCKMTAVA